MPTADVTTKEYHEEGLDALDYELLCLLDDQPLWKTKAHEQLGKRSIQTIGRRINKLQERGLLTTCVLDPDNLNRDLIIAFTTTDAGTALLTQQICQHCHVPRPQIDHRHEFTTIKNCFST